jgi:hypothetical protein
MLNSFRLTLAACAAVGVSLLGAHVVQVYSDTMLSQKIRVIAAEKVAGSPAVQGSEEHAN